MDEQFLFRLPHVVARELDISSATLRRWSDEFADFLSSEAGPADGRTHRRYTEGDLATLGAIKNLMNNGLTYEQVRQELMSHRPANQPQNITQGQHEQETSVLSGFDRFQQPLPDDEEDLDQQTGLVAASGDNPAISFLTNTITTLSDGQKSILNSQAANRELLGVLIQDNFNLKEENNRLRERVLEVERDLAKVRQEDEWRREALRQELDGKIALAQQTASQALAAAQNIELPEIKAVKTRTGCLGMLFGGGDTKIITVPRRRDRKGPAGPSAGAAPASPPYPPTPSERPPAHPKPFYPPE